MPVKRIISHTPTPVYIWTDDVDDKSIDQLENVANMPFVTPHVAVMPDVHLGIGATIGSVIPTKNAIIPASVGVDIGCGMLATRLNLKSKDLPDNLSGVRAAIEAHVPVGFNMHKVDAIDMSHISRDLSQGYFNLIDQFPHLSKVMREDNGWLRQIGTLGGGNHFIEVCLDENEDVWIMLHSGSRGIGNKIGTFFIAKAKEEMLKLDVNLPDKNLAYFKEGTESFDLYWNAVSWAQDYAVFNRRSMLKRIFKALQPELPPFKSTEQVIECHHNYVNKEVYFGEELYITRKGAIQAREGQLGIVPGSMGDRSYIVRGKGEIDSFRSSAHGAGRHMSRTEARKRFTHRDVERQTEGVECRKDKSVVDEIPAAYKNIDEVMVNQNDLVSVVHTLKQVVCVKG